MSRIYDALKRAADEARRHEVPAAPPAPPRHEEPPPRPAQPLPLLVTAQVSAGPAPEPATQEPVPAVFLEDLGAAVTEQVEPARARQVVPKPGTYRDLVREALREKLAQERERMAAAGRHAFEGNWLTLQEIRALRWRLRLKDLGIVFQLLLLFAFLALLAVVFHRALVDFLLPRLA